MAADLGRYRVRSLPAVPVNRAAHLIPKGMI